MEKENQKLNTIQSAILAYILLDDITRVDCLSTNLQDYVRKESKKVRDLFYATADTIYHELEQ